jgi:hypothetical protein
VFRLKSGDAAWERVEASADQLLHIEATPARERQLFALSYNALLTSEDGGMTWTHVPGPLGVKVSAFLGGPDRLMAGTDVGLSRAKTKAKFGNARRDRLDIRRSRRSRTWEAPETPRLRLLEYLFPGMEQHGRPRPRFLTERRCIKWRATVKKS